MMKGKYTYLYGLMLIFGLLLVSSYNSSRATAQNNNSYSKFKEKRNIANERIVTAVDLASVVKMTYVQDTSISGIELCLLSERAPLSAWKFKIEGTTLIIRPSGEWNKYINGNQSPLLNVTLKCPKIDNVVLDVASEFNVDRYVSNNSMTLGGSGASGFYIGDMKIGGQLSVNVSGACNMQIASLSSTNAKIGLSGACTVNIENLSSPTATVVGSGAVNFIGENIDVRAVTVKMSGASDAYLEGEVDVASLSASGVSKIRAQKLLVNNNMSTSKSGESDIKISNPDKVTQEVNLGGGRTYGADDWTLQEKLPETNKKLQSPVKKQKTSREEILEP